jgi:hypothetical protein
MGTEITIEVTELHAQMFDETCDTLDDEVVKSSVEDFIHNLYKEAKTQERRQAQQLNEMVKASAQNNEQE